MITIQEDLDDTCTDGRGISEVTRKKLISDSVDEKPGHLDEKLATPILDLITGSGCFALSINDIRPAYNP